MAFNNFSSNWVYNFPSQGRSFIPRSYPNDDVTSFGQYPYSCRTDHGQGQTNNSFSNGFGQRPYGQTNNSFSNGFGQRQTNNSFSNGFGQRPYGQTSNSFSNGYGQRPYGQTNNSFSNGYGQRPYGQTNNSFSNGFGQRQTNNSFSNGFGQRQTNNSFSNGFGQPPYGQTNNSFSNGFGQPPYGQANNSFSNGFGQPPYGQTNTFFPNGFGQANNSFYDWYPYWQANPSFNEWYGQTNNSFSNAFGQANNEPTFFGDLIGQQESNAFRDLKEIEYELTRSFAVEPTVFDDESPGIDLYFPAGGVGAVVQPGEQIKINTHVIFKLPKGTVGIIMDKSSVVTRKQLKVEAGLIDTGYRGEIVVVLRNMSRDVVEISPGEAIAQMLLQETCKSKLTKVIKVDANTHRGTRGFGERQRVDRRDHCKIL
ncbi:probable serine/threonine-protein kinase clkA [Argiope bruennichi]|uniref:probable serine/threonine-protein kinase clkA n=1 Tax=Argiope bruennichi TaxID=94029 RepID=UPI0024948AEB|nr:probable serine/threonine-protein kinase clkA [Argiope bruennichi]XP_055938189.1 probable serine/threonine-protein kinase clkA [Argiope bruennichi]